MNSLASISRLNQVYPLSIAPMMDRTDRHYRYFMRQITRRTLLYTEMVTTAAILHGDQDKLLGFSPEEKPLVLQLGGDNPNHLATCAKIAEDRGYDQINLNVGCPSDRVQDGNFGACLMAQPELVAKAVEAMQKVVNIPVTIKQRIGIDDQDKYEDMADFVRIVANAGCQQFTIHARKAWLQGLSPKENRNIPPLRYEEVHRLKQEFPQLLIEINGGFKTLAEAKDQLQFVDAVMIGRAAYDHPYLFATADQEIYGEKTPPLTRQEVIEAMYSYIEYWLKKGVKLNSITRHFLELFAQQPGTKAWKRYISENAHLTNAGIEVLQQALKQIP
ncbi:MAG TPA: tRNA dihydrouridine(20/20a) synthase DusA [Planktothrix sp. UBA8407]|jgi:tRNA dihydrouridine synthase A|nr:tRNA dihydrouridine(20/20a) synthase DusA [Planktothrix sp. UBA8402]HAO11405.1 tRNA dihydrouridine(20/20a) synthase DusA [Planktothrix sp. UBA8407]HBK22894.1 tRNA dihydrouridine(20/20a) synthase DusA [Planktothrix sp. UBA10369]